MKKKRIIFTDNRQSKRGIMSFILAVICVFSLVYGIMASYRLEGNVGVKFGGAMVITLVMSVTGMVLGINARMDSNNFKLLPTLGIILNGIVIIVLGVLLQAGLR